MADKPAARPSLRLIAGDLVSSLAHDVAEIAEVALTGKIPEEREKAASSSDQPEKASRARTVAVIGGGIAGLSAAWSLVCDRPADADIWGGVLGVDA